MVHVKAFAAGFVSVLLFHQGTLWLLAHGNPAITVWDLTPIPPFGVPKVISASFWGGLWGIVLWPVIRSARGSAYWIRAGLFGALALMAVAMFVVAPIKGLPIAFGWDPKFIVGGLIVNGAWGLGAALLIRMLNRAR